MDILTLQAKYPTFTYVASTWSRQEDSVVCTFSYAVGAELLTTTTQLHGPFLSTPDWMDEAVFQLGLAEMLSYWKAFCSPVVEIKAGRIEEEARTFWETLFLQGLGEFFYQNEIQPFVPTIVVQGPARPIPTASPYPQSHPNRVLVPVGGGKDSIVALEILAAAGESILTLCEAQTGSQSVIDVFASRHPIDARITFVRTLDEKLARLNANGHPNGHTPFSSMLAFLSLIVAGLTHVNTIALANECSANEPTTFWHGIDVNHQYSKSIQFEEDFRAYSRRIFGDSVPSYSSFLRPLAEIQIVEIFSRLDAYFPVFRSCNVGKKTNTWCGKCPKCVFVALLLSVFLRDEELNAILGVSILEDASLSPVVDALIGRTPTKPFECVGTRRESILALSLAIAARLSGPLPALLAHYADDFVGANETETIDDIFLSLESRHTLTPQYNTILQDALPRFHPSLTQLRAQSRRLTDFCAAPRHVIVGYGREGRSTHQYLRRIGFSGPILIVDDHIAHTSILEDSHALLSSLPVPFRSGDIVWKTPGIPVQKLGAIGDDAQLTSQATEFVRLYGPQTIGITGTKGKSTTAAAIAACLRALGHDVHLAGNIGLPLFEIIPILRPWSVVVAELSAFQCELLDASPSTCIFTSLYRDHLDYYPTFQAYQDAKLQLLKSQSQEDRCLYRPDAGVDVGLLSSCRAQKIPYNIYDPTKDSCWVDDGVIWFARANGKPQAVVATDTLRVIGRENIRNLLPAVYLSCTPPFTTSKAPKQLQTALQAFEPLAGRLEKVATVHGISFYDDAVATIPEATIAAIESLGEEVETLIVGGFDRGQEYDALAHRIAQSSIRTLIALPTTGERIGALVQALRPKIQLVQASTMEQVIEAALQKTRPGKAVLLSTAAPSYSGFADYRDRSAQYLSCIKKSGNASITAEVR